MKKILFVLVIIFSISLVSALTCEQSCAEQKNQKLSQVAKMKGDLASCRPQLLVCVNEKVSPYSSCQKQYSECKWGGIRNINMALLEVNSKYKDCTAACEVSPQESPSVALELIDSKIPQFCVHLNQARPLLLKAMSAEKLNAALKLNNCPNFVGL